MAEKQLDVKKIQLDEKEAQLNDDELKLILKRQFGDDNFEIIETNLKPFSDNFSGFTSEHTKLKILSKRNNKLITNNYFVKHLIDKDAAIYELVISENCFEKEVFAYTKLIEHAKKFNKNVNLEFMPKFYFGSEDIIVLEDLSLHDYKMINAEDITEEHILSALKSLAKFHSISFLIEEQETIRRKRRYKLIDDYCEKLREGMLRNNPNDIGYKLTLGSFQVMMELSNYMPEGSKEFQEQYERMFKLLLLFFNGEAQNKYRCVCCHGDLWLNNIIYKQEDDDLKSMFVDYQFVRYAPPAHDVTFVLYQICDDKLIKKYRHFLHKYYEYLGTELKNYGLDVKGLLPIDEYEETCKIYLSFSKIIKTQFFTFNAASEESRQEILADNSKMRNFLYGNHIGTCKNFMETQENYRQTLLKLINDLFDGFINKINRYDCYHILNQIVKENYDILSHDWSLIKGEDLFNVNAKIWKENSEEVEEYQFVVNSTCKEIVSCKKIGLH